MARIKLEGKKELHANFELYEQALYRGAYRALLEIGNVVKKEARSRTPVDTGYLKSTAYKRTYRGSRVVTPYVEIGYTAYYAPHVHENLEANFRVGEARFLANAINVNRQVMSDILWRHMRQTVGESVREFKLIVGYQRRFVSRPIPDPRMLYAAGR